VSAQPLVSCIMPTRNRRRFVAQSVWYFLRQDYEARELVVVDDGEDRIDDLLPEDGRIRYVHIGGRRPLGEKRNIACEQARGDLIAHWDDDDWNAPNRLSAQIAALATPAACATCSTTASRKARRGSIGRGPTATPASSARPCSTGATRGRSGRSRR
jgi:glycosyltransferase involved in cell wall biosynthesis